jgi:hypothetical protein
MQLLLPSPTLHFLHFKQTSPLVQRRNIASPCGDNDTKTLTLYRQIADQKVIPGGRPTYGSHWSSEEISIPFFFSFRAEMPATLHLIHSSLCILRSDGAVLCVPPYKHVVTCSANLRHWPYDTHTCTMMIGSWTHTGDQMNISVIQPGVRISWHQCVWKDSFCFQIQKWCQNVTNRLQLYYAQCSLRKKNCQTKY